MKDAHGPFPGVVRGLENNVNDARPLSVQDSTGEVMMNMRKLLGAGAALVLAAGSTLASAETKTVSIGYVEGWSDSVATTLSPPKCSSRRWAMTSNCNRLPPGSCGRR